MSATQDAKNSAAQSAEQTKQVGGDKLGQAKQGTADTTKAAQDKAGAAKNQAGSALEQAGNTVTDTFNNLKNSVTGK